MRICRQSTACWSEQSWPAYRAAKLCLHIVVACRALVCPSPTPISLSLLSLSPPPDCGRQASRADGILASRMTLVFLPLVLILQSWLSKPNPTLARAAGPMPALLLSTQRLFITARVLASSSAYTYYLYATRLLPSILVLSCLPILPLANVLYSQKSSVSTISPSPPLLFLRFLCSLLQNRQAVSLSLLPAVGFPTHFW